MSRSPAESASAAILGFRVCSLQLLCDISSGSEFLRLSGDSLSEREPRAVAVRPSCKFVVPSFEPCAADFAFDQIRFTGSSGRPTMRVCLCQWWHSTETYCQCCQVCYLVVDELAEARSCSGMRTASVECQMC